MNVYFHVTERLTDLCWESDIIKNARKKRKIISKESIPQQMFTIRKWCPFHIYCEWIRFMESHIHGILHGLCMRSKENEAMSEASIFHNKTLQSLLHASQSSPNITFSHGTGIVIRFWLFVFVSFNIFFPFFLCPSFCSCVFSCDKLLNIWPKKGKMKTAHTKMWMCCSCDLIFVLIFLAVLTAIEKLCWNFDRKWKAIVQIVG